MDVVRNILGEDVKNVELLDEETKMLKHEIHLAHKRGDKAGVMHLQERLEGLM